MAFFFDLFGVNEWLVASYYLRALLSSFILYQFSCVVYRLYVGPLARFPGPKLAAASSWYEFYWSVVRPGQFTLHLQALHDQYGPIVRINPSELHIRDPDFYEVAYDGGKRDKVASQIAWIDTGLAAHSTVDHDHHKLRRTAQNPFFSKRQIQKFCPYIQSRADLLCQRLMDEYDQGRVAPLGKAYGCLSGDVVMEYSFAKNDRFLEQPDFYSPFLEGTHALESGMHILINFPWLLKIVKSLPDVLLPSSVELVWNFKRSMRKQIQDIIDGRNQGYKDAAHPTVFRELLDSDLPPNEKTADRLQDEGVTIVGAGQDTVRAALTVTTFFLLKSPATVKRLREEIMMVYPDPLDPPELSKLEQLPYFSAVIKEGLRLSFGTVSRMSRVSHTPIKYGNYIIPQGTPISMNHYCSHMDETVFPAPHSFIPERWLNNPKAAPLNTPASSSDDGEKLLTRYLISFSRGPRSCVGMHLAYAELYIVLATVIRRCEMELFETEYKDIGFLRDYYVPLEEAGSKGLQVLVKEYL